MPEPAVPRPRSRAKAAEPISLAAPQSALATVSEVERRMLTAIEDLHAATRELGLPPQSISIGQRNGASMGIEPEQLDVIARVDQRLADLDAMALGPQPVRLSALSPPADPDAFLVTGFIRPGTTVMLAGPPGSGKSWASRQLALSCGAGVASYLEHYDVARPMNVLIVDEDNGPDEEYRRDETLLRYLDLQRPQLARVHRTSLAGVQLDQPAWQAWLRGLILHLELDLVILDPVSEMHGGKELREDPAFRSLLGFLKRLKVEFNRLATILVHHTRKADAKSAGAPRTLDEVRGQWGQTPDVVALMSPIGERRVSWELHKRVPHSKYLLEVTEAGPIRFLVDEMTIRDQRDETDGKVLSALEAGAATVEEIRLGTGLSKSGIYKALRRLAGANLVSKRAPYQLLDGD